MTPGERLKAWRTGKGMSQEVAAAAAGLKQSAWSQYEADKKVPRVDQAVALAALTAGDSNAVTVEMFAALERARADAREAARAAGLAHEDDDEPSTASGEHPAPVSALGRFRRRGVGA